jgi:hypothetical protein
MMGSQPRHRSRMVQATEGPRMRCHDPIPDDGTDPNPVRSGGRWKLFVNLDGRGTGLNWARGKFGFGGSKMPHPNPPRPAGREFDCATGIEAYNNRKGGGAPSPRRGEGWGGASASHQSAASSTHRHA